jgi:hypothetical protein
MSSVLWTACIGVTLYIICDKDSTAAVEKYEKFYHLIAWLIPAIDCACIIGLNLAAPAEVWLVAFLCILDHFG